MRRPIALAALITGVVLLVVAVTAILRTGDSTSTATGASVATTPAAAGDELSRRIVRAQQGLQANPSDYRTWADLGGAYVEQARITADPSYYPKAQGALEKSLAIDTVDNDIAQTGLGALANARHLFAEGADRARAAQAINADGATSYGVLADALTQLGDYDGATAALTRMVALDPDIAAITRVSYNLELHGNVDGARSALEQALSGSTEASDISYCRTYLGALAFSQGDLVEARTQYEAGLAQAAGEPTLLLGIARVDAAEGDSDAALAGYAAVVAARPLPDSLVEYGDYLTSLGRTDEAQTQYSLFDTTQKLFAANGVQDSLTLALLAANHGDPVTAVAAAQTEWAARQNVDAADALAWALHSAGRDAEALPYAQQATAISARNASFLYHRGVIEAAVGQSVAARSTLALALQINPHFSPLYAPLAQQALAAVGGPL